MSEVTVTERTMLADGLALLWLRAPEFGRGARPGQFVMLHPGDGIDPFLPRPFWIHRVRQRDGEDEVAVVVQARGRVSALLAAASPGRILRGTGPLGRPIAIQAATRTLLLIAHGIGVAPLVWCAEGAIARGCAVTLVIAAETERRLYPIALVPPEIEVAVVTDDGSAGVRGDGVALLSEFAGWADEIVASGPDDLYRGVAAALRAQLWRRPCSVVVNVPMPCGTGLCGCCGIAGRRDRFRLACLDGPVIDIREMF